MAKPSCFKTVMRPAIQKVVFLSALLCMAGGPAPAQDLASFEADLTELVLSNGLKVLVLERNDAPVVTCYTHVDVGSADEVKGITGLAHVFEHMAFKGTTAIGTRDFDAEAEVLAEVDETFQALKGELLKSGRADPERLTELRREFAQAQERAQDWIVPGEYEEILKRAGATGLNAATSSDYTVYLVSLPSNKLELWMLLESERFRDPVMREFYKEKNVVMEERRLRVENQPMGLLMEEFLAAAYKAHPYGEPVIGHMSDLMTITRAEAEAFFRRFYVPANMTVAIVGDVEAGAVEALAGKYLARIPSRPKPDPVETVEPPQTGERRVVVEVAAQPAVLIGFHKPDIRHADDAVFDAITDIMGMGRTSRLYASLVKERRIAVAASAFQGMPGVKYPGLFLFYAVPARGHTPEQCLDAILEELERLKREPVAEAELRKAKTRARAALIRGLDSNMGLARQLTFYEAITGDWRNLFRQLDRIRAVTPQDILRVAGEYFVERNRTVAFSRTVAMDEPSGGEE